MRLTFLSPLKRIPFICKLYYLYSYHKHFKSKNNYYNKDISVYFNTGFIFLLAPDYSNLGDVGILVSSIRFFEDNHLPIKSILISKQCANKKTLKKIINENDVLILQGGGNLGSLYRVEEMLRQNIIKWFPKNKIISLPQSIYFQKNRESFLRDSVKTYTSHSKLIVCVRDKQSYDFCLSTLHVKTLLIPDMVLWNCPTRYEPWVKNKRVLFCVRNDFEKGKNSAVLEKIYNYISCGGYIIESFDTDDGSGQDIENKEARINNLLAYFASFEFVVTDRFHGTVFSYITETPCIAFDNIYGKISNAFFWYTESNYMFFVETYENALKAINEISLIKSLRYGKELRSNFRQLEYILKNANYDLN